MKTSTVIEIVQFFLVFLTARRFSIKIVTQKLDIFSLYLLYCSHSSNDSIVNFDHDFFFKVDEFQLFYTIK